MPMREYTDFSGGVNQQIGPVVSENKPVEAMFFAEDAQNMEMSEAGLIKFFGYDNVLSSALSGLPTCNGLFEYDNAGTLELIYCGGGKVFKISGSSSTQIYTGATSGNYYQSAVYNNTLILCNGIDTPLYYDGTTCAAITFTDHSTPIWASAKPQGATEFRGRLLYWGDPTYPHRIYSPRPGTYNNFDNTLSTVDAFDVAGGSGGKLTGVRVLTEDLCILYKQNSIHRLSGSTPFGSTVDPFQISTVSAEIGCVAPRSIVQVGLEQYFLGQNGLRQLKPIDTYGDIEPLQPTYPIQPLIKQINYTNRTALANACAVYFQPDNKIYLAVPYGSATTNNKIFTYDTITKTNEPRDGINAAALVVFNRSIYHGGYSDGQLYKHGEAYSHDGTDIAAFWESKYIAHAGIGTYKRYKRAVFYAEGDGSADIVIQWTLLQGGEAVTRSETSSVAAGGNVFDSAVWDTATWSTGATGIFEIPNLGRGKAIKFRLSNTSSSQRPKIRQINLFFEVFGTAKG